MAASTPLHIPAERLNGLRRYNLIAGVFHLVQAAGIFALANSFALPVSVSYLQDAPVPGARFEDVALFDFPIAIGVALFSLLSAFAHFWIVGPGFRSYTNDLSNMRNIARWVEYSISSTIMIVLITLINGIWNLLAILAIAGCKKNTKNLERVACYRSGSDVLRGLFRGLLCSGCFSHQRAAPNLLDLSTALSSRSLYSSILLLSYNGFNIRK